MLKKITLILILVFGVGVFFFTRPATESMSGAPPYGEPEENVPVTPFEIARNWVRPDGPPKVGVQVGHWNSSELPEELAKLRNNTGASGGGKWEWEVNHDIATRVSQALESVGVSVDILPATVPPRYWADVFIAIHADGSLDTSKSGYKFAGPWRDLTGKSKTLVSILEKEYEAETGLIRDENVTRNMRGYYAFSWWRYEHAVHPMTTSVIAETGFLTNRNDQRLLINTPEVAANAISNAIVEYLKSENLLF